MKVPVIVMGCLLLAACQRQAPQAAASHQGLCPTDSTGLVTEDRTAVAAWKADLVSCGYGPAQSDAVETTLFVKEEGQALRRLAAGLAGPLHPLPAARRVFACEDNSILGTAAPLLIGLDGKARTLLPHAGSQRSCDVVGTGEQVLVQYDDAADADSKPFSVVRVYDADGNVLVEQRFEQEGSVAFTVDGKPYTAEVLQPELPG